MNRIRKKSIWTVMILAIGMITAGCGKQSTTADKNLEVSADELDEGAVQSNSSDFAVEFINVGKADSALIQIDGKAYLIDTGEKKSVPAITAALEAQGIKKLDGVFLTHTHSDHIGGLKKLSKQYSIETVYSAEISMNQENGENKIDTLINELGLDHVKLTAGDEIPATDEIAFEVIGPIIYNSEDDNDNSLVMRLMVSGKVFLFTGDMQFAEENSLIKAGVDLSADVLKVGNHGNPDATSNAFAELVSPELAVISTDTSVDKDSANMRVRALFTKVCITEDYKEGIRVSIDREGNLVIQNE